MTQKFVPLHNHCDTSFLDGYQTAEELCDRCEELGVTACALTDHGTCAGHEMFDWQIVSRKLNFKPIFGIEAYLCEDVDNHTSDRVAKDKKGNVKYDPKTGEPVMEKQKPRDFNHACLWAQDDEGLENLWTLSTLAYTDGFYYKPRIDLAMLRKHHKGLFVSDGCMLSQVSRAIVSGNIDKAYEWEQKLIDIFGKDNVLVEIHTWQFVEPHTDEQRKLNEDMCKTNLHKIQIARKLGLRMIAVNDSHYAKREDYKWHELEWATTTGKGDAYNDDKTGGGRGETAAWVMSDDEVRYWLGRHSIPKDIIEECIDNTQWVAEHCNAKLKRGMVPPRYKETKEEDEKHFDKVLMDGIRELVPRDKVEQYLDELNKEVELIKKSDLTGYFNTVADYSNFVRDDDVDGEKYGIPGKKASVLGPGRGSAGGSLVCYLMHITNVDPIRFGLFFERFLTAGRVMETVTCEYEDGTSKTFTDVHEEVKLADGTTKEAWQQIDESWDTEYGKLKHTSFVFKDCPDIDLDFEAAVIPYLNKYLKLKYGEYGFCQIGTQLLLKMSMAIKDVGKVHGMTPAALNDVVKRMAATGWRMEDWVSEHTYEEMVEWFCKTHRDEVVADLFENSDFMWQAYNWGGRFRGEGVHASGYVISKQSMLGKLPLRIKDGVLITQFEHNGVARLGFIKYDILKLSSLGVIRECYELTHNGELDVRDVYREMRDERTSENAGMWKQTWSGDTIGIFQMDTPLGTKTAMNARMKSLRDAAMLSAVDRPGMVISGRINDFYKVRLGKEPIMQYHPFVDDILAETSGFIVYQEQIMSIFGRLCHYNPAQRDYIRKIIGKKLRFEMPKQKAVLDKCCLEDEAFVKAVPSKYKDAQECVDDLWNGITGAGSYAFNKSHCLHGATNVKLANGEVTSLAKLYKKYKAGEELSIMCMMPDGSIAPGKVAEVIDSGVKELLTVTLANKKVIRATAEHRFLTTSGYKALKDIEVGDELIYDNSQSYANTKLSESMKRTQAGITYEQRCEHQRRINELHPERCKIWQKAGQEKLRELRDNPEWKQWFSKQVSEAQKEYWSHVPDRHFARNWAGWSYWNSWDADRLTAWKLQKGLAMRKFYKGVSPEWLQQWQHNVVVGKRRNGVVNFGKPTMLSDGRLCDSMFEAQVGQYLLDRGIEFELHKIVHTKDGHKRITDFYVDGLYIEADGLWRGDKFFKDRKYGDDLPFVVLTPDSWKYTLDAALMGEHVHNGVKVVSIESKPLPGRWHNTYAKTYDVVMDDHYPANFIANGVVSHNSVAYGMITYEQQRYKYKHPEVFMVASMNNNMGDPEYVTYAKVHGMQIAPPNVNKSSWRYELSDGAIYMPLSIIKGVGGAAVDEILRGQPFSSFDDYLARTSGRGGKKRNIVKALISVGAFDGVDERDRFQLMVDYKTSIKEEPPKRNTWKSARVRGKIEQELIGISLSYDPVLDNRQWLESQGPQTYADMLQHEVGDGICIAGKVESIRRHIQKNGGEMAWIAVQLVSHEVVTVTMFATNWSKCKDLVAPNDIVAFNCKRTNDYNGKMSIVGFSCKNHSIELSQEEA